MPEADRAEATGGHHCSEVRAILDGERSAGLQPALCRVADPVEPLHAGECVSEVAGHGRRVSDRGEDRGDLRAVGSRDEPEVDQVGLEFCRDLTADDGNPWEHLHQDCRRRRCVDVRVGCRIVRNG